MKIQSLITGSLAIILAASVRADIVTDWTTTMIAAATANASTDLPPVTARKAAIVQTAIFDAVNGIAGKYESYFVAAAAPPGARQEAAAAQAAYTTLVALYPNQKAMFDAQLSASLATIAGIQGNSQSIQRGLAWGEQVANA